MPRILVVRHGQTTLNAERVLQGPRIDGELSELGHHQAHALANALGDTPLHWVFSSPLRRARDTAQAIADRQDGNPAVQVVPELYEVDYGLFAGRRVDDIQDELDQVLDAWRMGFVDESFPGGESALLAQHRVRPFAQRLKAIAREEDACVVAHGRVNRVLVATLLEWGLRRLEEIPQDNAAITELAVGPEDVKLVRLNDVSHLDLASDSFS